MAGFCLLWWLAGGKAVCQLAGGEAVCLGGWLVARLSTRMAGTWRSQMLEWLVGGEAVCIEDWLVDWLSVWMAWGELLGV